VGSPNSPSQVNQPDEVVVEVLAYDGRRIRSGVLPLPGDNGSRATAQFRKHPNPYLNQPLPCLCYPEHLISRRTVQSWNLLGATLN
jgi:hypothetical protein